MRERNRYTRLTDKIRRKFEKVRTEAVSIDANGRELVANADDDDWRGENEPFSNYAPYNAVSVQNDGETPVRVYLDRKRDHWFDVPPASSRSLDTPLYFAYLSVSNQGDTAADVTVSYGRAVDTRELRILEMSGMLDIRE